MPPVSQKVIIIGGGFAGLSAATALAEKNFLVTVLEGRQVLGGRAFSFVDPVTGDTVDNGQHLFMGCYRETQAFLKRIGCLDRLIFQKNLKVNFVSAGGRLARLSCWPLPPPWHLLSGLARLSTLSLRDRWNLRFVERSIREASSHKKELNAKTVTQWLVDCRQSERARRNLWDLIAIATLNENPDIASAGPFVEVLRRAFFQGRSASQLGFSSVGLSDLYTQAARTFVEFWGGDVRLKSPVDHLELKGKTIRGVVLRTGERIEADCVISAVPFPALLRLLPSSDVENFPLFRRLKELKSAPIIGIHLWFDRNLSDLAFAGLLDTQTQWYFNRSKIIAQTKSKRGHVSLVISGAHTFMDWKDSSILNVALEELRRLFPKAREANLIRSLVIKEQQATLSPSPGTEELRAPHASPYPNLFLAGDWTQTGLPATIESACQSGHSCARLVMDGPWQAHAGIQEAVHAER